MICKQKKQSYIKFHHKRIKPLVATTAFIMFIYFFVMKALLLFFWQYVSDVKH